jgi:hypothetical protein
LATRGSRPHPSDMRRADSSDGVSASTG